MDIVLFEILFGMFFTGLGGILGYLRFKRNVKKDNDDQIRHDTKIDLKLDDVATMDTSRFTTYLTMYFTYN